MKTRYIVVLSTIMMFLGSVEVLSAQFGSPFNNGYGRGRSTVPRAQDTPKPPEPMTVEEVVDDRMPSITEALELNPFEEAVVRTTLIKYGQQRTELRILELEPNKMREEMEKISKKQEAEMKAGLPEDKFEAYLELQKNYFNTKKMKKKKKKKKKDKS